MEPNSSSEFPKAYDPKVTEKKWVSFWSEQGFFVADASSKKPPYTIVIPPPNVTGVLHMGHALVNTLQDILIRWKRMSGFEALWIPGTDHAGIATQAVVERHLLASEGKRRKDLSREEFVERVWEWKERHENRILDQLKKMGCSCDWSRLRFTMDAQCNKAVSTAFKRLFEAGLIYRGNYLVNWDPVTQTALSDDEVEYEERDSFLWYIRYPFASTEGHIVVATTRPETLLGDTAVAVAPSDSRYAHLAGKNLKHPLCDREIPLILDHYVDPAFGTGAVKITPAHDFNDYQIGVKHKLPFINVLTPEGKINEAGGEFEGLDRNLARERVVEKLQSLGLIEKIVPYRLRAALSYRSKAVLEPYLSKQWFIKMEPFITKLSAAVKKGEVKILPKVWESTYFHWVNNLRDWCISRQLWWGHRIPIWYNRTDPEKMLCYTGEGLPPEVAAHPEQWEQESDVLDTWFSSALWPLSTLGWPEASVDLKKFYPTSVLVTGHDILFFWVARMLLMDQFLSEEFPFPEVFLHGLIYGKSYWHTKSDGMIAYVTGEEKRDYDLGKPLPPEISSRWEKLSKSKGNVIDPLDLIEEYGTDAMRLSLCASANQYPQIDLDRRRFEEFKNFANKIWNGARFVFLHIASLTAEEFAQGVQEELLSFEDRWILSVLNRSIVEVNQALSHYSFDAAAQRAYDFFWKEFCAYYLEVIKPILFSKQGTAADKLQKQKILVILLTNALRLMHPMAPFITEELFQRLKSHFGSITAEPGVDLYTAESIKALQSPACTVAPYPQLHCQADMRPDIEEAFLFMDSALHAIRNIRGEMQIPPGTAIDIFIFDTDQDERFKILQSNLSFITALVKIGHIEICLSAPQLPWSATAALGSIQIIIPLPQEMRTKERARLEKEHEKLVQGNARLETLLSNPEFLAKAQPSLVEQQRNLLKKNQQELILLLKKLEAE